MGGDNGGRRRTCQTVAVTLLLCSLVLCFSLWGLGKKVKKHEGFGEAAEEDRRNGSVLFNGKILDFQSGSASAAATGHGLLHVELHQSGNTAKYTSKLKNDTANEAAWRQLNASLHCGDKMRLNAMGPGAADIQLHIDSTHPLPLKQVPESCGFSVQQNALGLVLIVPYNGCSVLTESGRYVLPMIWRGTAVKFICPVTNPDATPASTIPEPLQQPRKVPFSLSPWHVIRSKRQAKRPFSVYYPNPYDSYSYNYYMHMMALATAKTKPTTTNKHPQTKPPAYSYPLYYPYNAYYPYYFYHLLPNPPAMNTVPPTTTTVRPSSNRNPPQSPAYYASYFPYMHYLPPGQQLQIIPEKTQVYYYPNTEFFYGRPPYKHETNLPTKFTWSQFTTAAMPGDPAPPMKPSYQSPISPTSSSAPTAHIPIGYNHHLDVGGPYVPFEELPFKPYVVYKSRKLPDDHNYMVKADFKSGVQGQQGFPWQVAPSFLQFTGQEHP